VSARGVVGLGLMLGIGCGQSGTAPGADPPGDRPPNARQGDGLPTSVPAWLRPPKDAATSQPAPPDPRFAECFAAPVRYDVEGTAMPLALGDLDANGRVDVLEYDQPWDADQAEYLVPYLGGVGGQAGLTRGERVRLGEMNLSFATGDLDADGKLDAVVAGYREKRLLVFPGQGDGTFGAPRTIATARKPNGVAIGDLTGDGVLDVVVTYFSHLQLFTGDGRLGLRAGPAIKTDQAPEGPVVGDLDGDGDLDVGTVGNDTNFFLTYLDDGHGRLRLGEHAEACGSPAYPIAADLDDDHDLDLAYMCDDGVELRLNDGRGRFTRVALPSARPAFVAAADVNGDGHTDLVTFTAELDSSSVVLRLGDGHGGWKVRGEGTLDGQVQGAPLVADLDGDGHPDLVLGLWAGRAPGAIAVLASRPCP